MIIYAKPQHFHVTPYLPPMFVFLFTLLVFPSMGSVNPYTVLYSFFLTIKVIIFFLVIRFFRIKRAIFVSSLMFLLAFVTGIYGSYFNNSFTTLGRGGTLLIVEGELTFDGYMYYAVGSLFFGLIAAIPTFFSAVIDAYIPDPKRSDDG